MSQNIPCCESSWMDRMVFIRFSCVPAKGLAMSQWVHPKWTDSCRTFCFGMSCVACSLNSTSSFVVFKNNRSFDTLKFLEEGFFALAIVLWREDICFTSEFKWYPLQAGHYPIATAHICIYTAFLHWILPFDWHFFQLWANKTIGVQWFTFPCELIGALAGVTLRNVAFPTLLSAAMASLLCNAPLLVWPLRGGYVLWCVLPLPLLLICARLVMRALIYITGYWRQ